MKEHLKKIDPRAALAATRDALLAGVIYFLPDTEADGPATDTPAYTSEITGSLSPSLIVGGAFAQLESARTETILIRPVEEECAITPEHTEVRHFLGYEQCPEDVDAARDGNVAHMSFDQRVGVIRDGCTFDWVATKPETYEIFNNPGYIGASLLMPGDGACSFASKNGLLQPLED